MTTLAKFDLMGNLPAGDVFDFGFHAETSATVSAADALTQFEAAFDSTWWAGIASLFENNLHVTRQAVRTIDGTTGSTLDSAETAISYAGSSSDGSLPQEVACCVSIVTATAGRSTRGRYYVPCFAKSKLDDQGLFPSANITTLVGALADAHNAMFADTPSWVVGVYSRLLHGFTPATQLRIGTVPDVQRRRRNKLVESRVNAPVNL